MPTRYDTFSRLLHWLMAGLIILVFILALVQDGMPRGEARQTVIALHVFIGAGLIALAVLRIVWAIMRRSPPDVAMPAWMALSAKVTHWALYALMLAAPVLGMWLYAVRGRPASLLGTTMPMLVEKNDRLRSLIGEAHELAGFLLIALAFLHAAAAFYHHFVLKDGLLLRMKGATPPKA